MGFFAGLQLRVEMDGAAKKTDKTIAVLSPDYLNANFTHPEWAAAFARDAKGTNRQLIPVKVRECDADGLLGQIVYVDLVGEDETTARGKLLNGVSNARAKPSSKPAYPGSRAHQKAEQPPQFPEAQRSDAATKMPIGDNTGSRFQLTSRSGTEFPI
jgi:TIR domain